MKCGNIVSMPMGPRDRHCRKTGCPCSHEHCDRGWLDQLDDDGNTVATRPCIACRTDLAAALAEIPDQSRVEVRRALARHRKAPMPAV